MFNNLLYFTFFYFYFDFPYLKEKYMTINFLSNITLKGSAKRNLDKQSFLSCKIEFRLVLSYNNDITHSDFSSVFIVYNNASSRTTVNWGLCIIIWSTTLTSMYKVIIHSTHLLRSLRIQVK